MKITGSEDLRVQKTIEGIYRAFEDLICEKEYHQITVKELCERARINKKTFYRYYPTLDDLLIELQETIAENYRNQIAGLRLPDDLEAITRAFCAFSASQGKAYERITCSVAYKAISEHMQELVMGKPDEAATSYDSEQTARHCLYMAFVTESALAIYRQWVLAGKPIPAETMTDLCVSLVCHGAESFKG